MISCRYAGYGGPVTLEDGFLHLDVRPLQDDQISKLVRLWFREVQRVLPDYPESEARAAAAGLVETLGSAAFASQRLKVLVSTPLLLTLLCVVVQRGGEMPKQRVEFYDQCLRVLLGKWGKARKGIEPLLSVETALAVLRPLAWQMHSRRRRDDVSAVELALHVERRLQELGHPRVDGFAVVDWLYRGAGVLEEYATQLYGFVHLGFQEYLAALHVASRGEELLGKVAAEFGEKWWREVTLLLVGLPPDRRVFAPLMGLLLATEAPLRSAALLGECVAEASEVDPEPFVEALAAERDAVRQAAVLRLLHGRCDVGLVELSRALSSSEDRDVAALSRQIVAECSQPKEAGSAAGSEVLLICGSADGGTAAELAVELGSRGLPASVAGAGWRSEMPRLVAEPRSVGVVFRGGEPAPWDEVQTHACLELFAHRGCRLVPVLVSGSAEPGALSDRLEWCPLVDLSDGLASLNVRDFEPTAEAAQAPEPAGVAFAVSAGTAEEGEALMEPVTASKLLWIPGGRFEMGSNSITDDEKPIHWVRVSPFWLGETPVTNSQYGIYLEGTGYEEPAHWRDRKFSAAEQPVVGVSWRDAVAYCEWLSRESGLAVVLPTEAQWEFAARGTDGRDYPWGNGDPDTSRACFGREKNHPAPVGSYPAGRGPFGTLDQAGNVWEWCLDAWDDEAYKKRAGEEVADPIVQGDSEDSRLLRGGSWASEARNLRAAYRSVNHPAGRNPSVGFRVCVSPPST